MSTSAVPAVLRVEQHGIDTIPTEDRNARISDLFRMVFGGANTFTTVVLGSFPILFGLPFLDALAVTVAGIVVGAVILCPMALFGPLTGTNNAVSSSAHLGVHGRIVGSYLSLLVAFSFFAISVWSSGDALVGGAHRFVGLPETPWTHAVAYGLFAALVLTIAVYGFRFLLWVNKVAVVVASVLLLLGAFAFHDSFNLWYAGSFGPSATAETMAAYWPAMIAAGLIVMANPISFGAFLGDWSRYLPTAASKRRVMAAVILGQLATLLPFTFGLVTASIIAEIAPDYLNSGNYVGGLLAIAPGWYFVPVCLLALVGGLSTGTGLLYGTGLDFSSVFPRFTRVQATMLIGSTAIVLIFIGRFVFDVVQSISTFALVIVTCTVPWMVIMTIGFFTRRGWYDPEALQVFNRRQRGGRYWYNHGWNWRAMSVWIVAAVAGLLFVNLPGQFVGPLGELGGGADLSIPVSLGITAALYPIVLWIFPEPEDVFGPEGPRWAPAAPARNVPIIPRDNNVAVDSAAVPDVIHSRV
ncbi:purine-cytosine permease family protein [Rhodococcus sp. NPDC057529]|uniref:purine-cytosine permease family protein n=1 Tax=Rhodococcus sp. NPDC057529 TaxID=3346158 RepID=UPI00366C1A29